MAALGLATGCAGWGNIDPFGFDERAIVGRYRLKAWEDGSFWFLTPADTSSRYEVTRLGWDRTHVVALLVANGPRYPGGWVVIDAATGRAWRQPSGGELAADSVGGRIPTFRADSAWDRLGQRAWRLTRH